MALGGLNLKHIALPAAWDSAELRRLELRDGTTYAALLADIDAAFSIVNAGLRTGYLAKLFSVTDEPTVEYPYGITNGFQDMTEYAQPDPKRGKTTGHMLPFKLQDRKMRWTWKFLKEARRAQIDADIASLIQDGQNAWEKALLTRLFKMEEESGAQYGLGSSGVSVPFADGGGGTIAFAPVPNPARAINTFDETHDHYLRLDGITQANLETAVGHLWEHGHNEPYELIVSLTDLSSWQNTSNVTGFVPKINTLVQYASTTSLAQVDVEVYQGAVTTKYGVCLLYANGRIPTTKWAVAKSYGPDDQRNPLRVRYDPIYGFGIGLLNESVDTYPLQGAIGIVGFGVGLGEDRVASVLVENDSSGDYATPTIS